MKKDTSVTFGMLWGSSLWPSSYRTASLTTEEDLLAAVLFDMSDGRRGPHSRLSLDQCCQGWVWTGGLSPEKMIKIHKFFKSTTNTFIWNKDIQAACVLQFEKGLTFGLWWPHCVWARCRSSRSPRYRPRPARGWSSGVLCSWVENSGSSLAVSPANTSNACALGIYTRKHFKASLIYSPAALRWHLHVGNEWSWCF